MECVVDTNVLVYETIEDSELHKEAIVGLEKIERRVIPTVVIEELVYVLKGLSASNEIIKGRVEELLKTEGFDVIPINSNNIYEAVNLVTRHKVSFSKFNDKLILSVAKSEKLPLFTFDKELKAECRKEGVELF